MKKLYFTRVAERETEREREREREREGGGVSGNGEEETLCRIERLCSAALSVKVAQRREFMSGRTKPCL